jgi:type IV pilus assembly protein PilV
MPEIDFYHKRGFTLIEVLISMIILAIGLLGMAMMQGRALKTNKDAYLYGQANLLAYEMADRMRANSNYWKNYPLPTPAIGNKCDSSADNCDAAAMAAYDYYRWQADAINLLPGVTTTTNLPFITRATTGTSGTATCTATSPCFTLTIQWTRTDSTTTITNKLGTTTASQQLGITL